MSDFKITDKSGIKLKTANTYVTEDLGVTLTDNDINNIVAGNIKKDVTILGVVGTFEGNPKPEQSKTVEFSPGSNDSITIAPDAGYALSSVQVNKPTTMIPSNIKSGIDIGGVVGTYEGSPATYWDGTYIEQNVFNVTINVETYDVLDSASISYSVDGGTTFKLINASGIKELNGISTIMFKYKGMEGNTPGPGSHCHVGTTSGGTDIINANDSEYSSTITTENIELTKDTTFYVNMVHN